MYTVNIHRASSEVNTSYTIILTLACEQALRSERIPGDMKRGQGKAKVCLHRSLRIPNVCV